MGFNIRQRLRLKAYCSLSSIKVLKCHLHSYDNTKLPIRGDQWVRAMCRLIRRESELLSYTNTWSTRMRRTKMQVTWKSDLKDELCTCSTYSVFLIALKDTMVWQFTVSLKQDPSSVASSDHFKKALYFREAHRIRTYSQNPSSGIYRKQS